MIGRNPSCQIRFDFPEVSERHAILTVRDGRAVVEDLHSANGTYVNGEPIDGPVVLDGGMVVQVGESMLRVCDENDWAVKAAEDSGQDEPAVAELPPDAENEEDDVPPPPDPMRELRRSVQEQIQKELLKRMDMKRLTMQGVDREGLEDTAREKIRQIIDEVVANGRLPDGIDPVRLEDDVFNEAMRLGPLEELLADDTVSEIMVNGPPSRMSTRVLQTEAASTRSSRLSRFRVPRSRYESSRRRRLRQMTSSASERGLTTPPSS